MSLLGIWHAAEVCSHRWHYLAESGAAGVTDGCIVTSLACVVNKQVTANVNEKINSALAPITCKEKNYRSSLRPDFFPRLNNTLNSSMCLLICSFPPLNRLNKVSVNNMLWCHILNNSFHSLPRGLSPFDGWPDRVSLFPESAHRQRLQNTTEWFYTLHLHLGHN